MTFWNYITRAFCESTIVNGKVVYLPSSKRLIGGLMIVVVLALTVMSVLKFGMTDNNKDIVMAEIITGCSLLGLTTLVNGFSKFGFGNSHKEEKTVVENIPTDIATNKTIIDNPDAIDNPDEQTGNVMVDNPDAPTEK